jgi:hypothetical protein
MSSAVVVAITAAITGTFGATRRMHERWRARWRLRNHDELDADAREGDLVYVSGVVRPLDETLVAPLSGRPCVAYRSRVHGYMLGSNTTIKHEQMQVRPFAIQTEDGESIVVDGDSAIFGVGAQKLSPRNPDRESSFRARHAIQGGSARFWEVAVELDAEVIVGGTLVLVPREAPPTGELGFRDPPPPDPQIAGNRETPLVILARGR